MTRDMRTKRPKIAVITLSWNAKNDLVDIFDCVKRQSWKPDRLIVADSGSTDGTEEMIRKRFPFVEFHALGKNMGYAAGYNILFSLVPKHIDYVVVLDQDVLIENNYIENVVKRFEKEPETTIILMCDLEEPRIKTFGLKEGYIKSYHGSCFSYRNRWKKFMKYDEKFFAYENEADLCARLMNRGLKILYYPGLKVFHKKDSTIMNNFRAHFIVRNAIWYWWKNTSFIDAIIGSITVMGVFYSSASKHNTLRAYFRAVISAFGGIPYCIRNREVCYSISFKDLDDLRQINRILERTRTKPVFRLFDYIYEKTKFYRKQR